MKPSHLLKCVAVALTLCAAAQAQTVYRIVGPDGKVTFSDKPPITADQGKVATTGVGAAAAASNASLPFELRQVVSKYPVTLYSAPDCAPCGNGRSLLSARGVPFSERTVTSQEDIASLQRISGETSLPVLTIGSQRIKGFSDAEWTQYLDAAGYPRTSMLPAGYRNAPASPLVTVQKPAPAKAEEKPEAPAVPASPSAPGPSNPAGIQF
ncbi:glutaredoxin family protein [Rhodoferax sp. GW822-FHT02A01]|uniref:glutaredoxin family protein n=1 Tax=Rhodoferax sp. GW822-FHT02A01 TaxID=3141537 RepID=UPI00315CE6B9